MNVRRHLQEFPLATLGTPWMTGSLCLTIFDHAQQLMFIEFRPHTLQVYLHGNTFCVVCKRKLKKNIKNGII